MVINGELRAGMKQNPNRTANFKGRNISFLLLDYTGTIDNYDKQEEVLAAWKISRRYLQPT